MNKYYDFWEDFIKAWSSGTNSYGGWADPDCIPIYNSKSKGDKSSDYLPEPWWGNGDTTPLHSVVINFNPGEAGPCQKRGCIKVSSYLKDVVGNPSVLTKARKWHESRRAMRVLNTLFRLKCISKPYGLENHLSVELIPWHTHEVNSDYYTYLSPNIQAVYDNSICFAANEANRIANKILQSVVIVRMNDYNTKNLLYELCRIGIKSTIKRPTTATKSGKAKYMEFQLTTLPKTRFICIWGRYRNDFPSNEDMDEIFSSI